jgi:hypothetical protein
MPKIREKMELQWSANLKEESGQINKILDHFKPDYKIYELKAKEKLDFLEKLVTNTIFENVEFQSQNKELTQTILDKDNCLQDFL